MLYLVHDADATPSAPALSLPVLAGDDIVVLPEGARLAVALDHLIESLETLNQFLERANNEFLVRHQQQSA